MLTDETLPLSSVLSPSTKQTSSSPGALLYPRFGTPARWPRAAGAGAPAPTCLSSGSRSWAAWSCPQHACCSLSRLSWFAWMPTAPWCRWRATGWGWCRAEPACWNRPLQQLWEATANWCWKPEAARSPPQSQLHRLHPLRSSRCRPVPLPHLLHHHHPTRGQLPPSNQRPIRNRPLTQPVRPLPINPLRKFHPDSIATHGNWPISSTVRSSTSTNPSTSLRPERAPVLHDWSSPKPDASAVLPS